MTKKILLITGILAAIALALFLIFSLRQEAVQEEGGGGFSIRDYLPFGRSEDFNAEEEITGEKEEVTGEEELPANQPIPRLRKISGHPVAGAVAFGSGTTTVVRFVEKGTGNVYEAKSDSNTIQRLTNTTIPKIVRAFWLPNGSGFIAQTLMEESEIIETNFVKLQKSPATSTNESLIPFNTTISKLPTGIKEIAVKPDSAKIFYYTVSSVSNWFVSAPDGTNAVLVFTHPITEWIPAWASGNTVVMQTKMSYAAESNIYSFDVSSRTLKKTGVIGVAISPETKTLEEKCVSTRGKNPLMYCAVPGGLSGANYPDIWYKGLIKTEDSIERVDLGNGISQEILDISEEGEQRIDVNYISLSPDETHLIFINKIDGFLWMLRIDE